MTEKNRDEQYLKCFGVFCGMFNRATNNGLSVKDALKSAEMIELFEKTCAQFNEVKAIAERVPRTQASTRRRSLQKTETSHLQAQVLAFLRANPNSSRREIAEGTGLLSQSMYGRVVELLEKKLIYVSGEKFDKLTKRDVELLTAAPLQDQVSGAQNEI